MCLPGTVGISSGELRAPPSRHASRSRRPAPPRGTVPTPGPAYGRATPNLRPTPASSIQIDAHIHPVCRRAGQEVKVHHGEGVAIHPDPESCVGGREAAGEALTGAHAGQPLSCEIHRNPGCRRRSVRRKATRPGALIASTRTAPRSRRPWHAWNSSHGNREIPVPPRRCRSAGRSEKAMSRSPSMHGAGKSDGRVVPEKPPNKAGQPAAEAVEGRRPTKGNTWLQSTRPGPEPGRACRSALHVCEKSTQGQAGAVHRAAAPCHGRRCFGAASTP